MGNILGNDFIIAEPAKNKGKIMMRMMNKTTNKYKEIKTYERK